MTDLLRAEFLRLASRRLTWIFFGLTVLLAAFVAISASAQARPLDEVDRQRAQTYYEQAQLDWELGGCTLPGEPCGEWEDLRVEDFQRTPVDYEPFTTGNLGGAVLVFIAATVLAAALVGGEFSSGSLSTQLTFTPRRGRVMAAKVTAATTGAVLLVFTYITVAMVIGTIMFLMLRGAGDVVAGPEVPLLIMRLLTASFLVAALASSLTFGLGSTALAIGAGSAALVGSEIALAWTSVPTAWLIRLMPTPNLMALLEYGYPYTVWDEDAAREIVVVGYWDALAYAAVLVVLVAAISALVFRRRNLLR